MGVEKSIAPDQVHPVSWAETPTSDARVGRRRFVLSGTDHPTKFIGILSYLRWIIPLVLAVTGAAYVLLEEAWLQGNSLVTVHVIRTVLVISLAGPTLAWLLLTWAMSLAAAEADAQAELALRNRELAALNAVGQVAGQSLNLEELLRQALERMVDLLGLQSGEIRVVEREKLVLKAHYGIPRREPIQEDVPLGYCQCGQCARIGETLVLENLPSVPALANLPCAVEGYRTIITVPMKTKGKVLGVILLTSRERSKMTPSDHRILGAIGTRIAASVENAQLYEQAKRRADHLQTASLVGQRMTSLLELNSLLAEVVNIIRTKFGYDHVHIFLVDDGTRQVVLKEASGPLANQIKRQGLRLKIGEEGITGWVAYTGQTIICNDIRREPRYHKAEILPDTKADMAIPLRVGTRIVGVLDVQSTKLNAFDKEDVTVLQILGNQIGIAIVNAQLYQETKQRYEAMIALHEVSLDMISQLDTTQLLEALLRRGAQLLGAQAGCLFLYDDEKKLIYNVASYNTWRDWSGVTLHPGEGVIGEVIQSGKPLIVNDYEHWPHRSDSYSSGSPQTRVIGVPLKWQDRIIGGIDILNDRDAREFEESDNWLLSHFADLATIAVKNAELHTQVKEFSQELELKVEERTEQLSKARDEIAAKAEQLQLLLAKTIDVQEEERARIARDMHDTVMQLISAARYEVQAAHALGGMELPRDVGDKLDTANRVLIEMEKELRRAIYDLHPPILDVVGLAPAVQRYVKNFKELLCLNCDLEVNGTPYRLPPAAEIAVFRLVEEALQNVCAHANATKAQVTLDYEPDLFCASVRDDGTGFDYKQWMQSRHRNHLGLLGMRERIENIGGKMELWSEPGQGTRVMFHLPIVQDEE